MATIALPGAALDIAISRATDALARFDNNEPYQISPDLVYSPGDDDDHSRAMWWVSQAATLAETLRLVLDRIEAGS